MMSIGNRKQTSTMWILLAILGIFLDVAKCSTRDRHYIVTSILVEPYLMINPLKMNHTGNDRYMGYIADLMEEVGKTLGVNYRYRIVKDSQYGNRRKDGSWNGMIGELIAGEAGIAAAPLYNTKQRQQVVDFTHPFLTVEATALMAVNQPNKMAPIINRARDLVRQNEIRYGTLKTGITVHAFRHTNDSDYKHMFENIKSFKPSVFTDSNKEGIERAREGSYAFIVPSTIGEYISMQAPCDLRAVDRFLMKKHFCLAVPKESYLVPELNEALSVIRKQGTFTRLYKKWWFEKTHCRDVKSRPVASYDQHYQTNGSSSVSSRLLSSPLLVLVYLYSLSVCGV